MSKFFRVFFESRSFSDLINYMNYDKFGTILEYGFFLRRAEGFLETASLPHMVGVRSGTFYSP